MKRKPLIDLFDDAVSDGQLSRFAAGSIAIADLGAAIQQGLGSTIDDVAASDVTLVTLLVDDSSSIACCNNEESVREGHNVVLQTLKAAPASTAFYVHARYLNGHVLYPYLAVDGAEEMNTTNYVAGGGTPLYDQTVVTLATVVAKMQEFTNSGIAARAITVIISDGADCGSSRYKAKDVAALIGDLVQDERHTVAAMGISDGQTDFRAVFQSMGIPDSWILTPDSSTTAIRQAFRVVSQSAIATGRAAALGGFGN